MRVVIVDDDKELADLLKTALQLAFYEKAKQLAKGQKQITESLDVVHFGDQKEALRFLSADGNYIDLIFVEINSPGLNGFDFIHLCQERYKNHFGEVIVVTDRSEKKSVKQGLEAGATDYILKPFGPNDLKSHIFNAWQHKKNDEQHMLLEDQ